MNQKVLRTLEYYKIIEKLTEYAGSEPGKKLCRQLEPSSDYDEIVQNQTETGWPELQAILDTDERVTIR